MISITKAISRKAGMPPGSLVHIGELPAGKTTVRGCRYSDTGYEEFSVPDAETLLRLKGWEGITWLQVDGVHQPEEIAAVGERFGLHALTQEDILNTAQRPKIEEFDNYIFLVGKIISFDERKETVLEKHFCLVLMEQVVISFQEAGAGDLFSSVKNRLQKASGKLRKKGADYLAYTLLDGVIDNYFLVLERIETQIEELEDDILEEPDKASLEWLHFLKRELTMLRKSVWPMREVINSLLRSDSELILEDTLKYLMDVYDHTMQIIETIDAFRDITASLYDMYLSMISNRLNEVMKVLTVIATIFIPLTFISGVYGMNFKYMPELAWRWGYFGILGLMFILGLGMVLYFKMKDWF